MPTGVARFLQPGPTDANRRGGEVSISVQCKRSRTNTLRVCRYGERGSHGVEEAMNALRRLALTAPLLIAGYAAFRILQGFMTGVICVGTFCARLGVRHEGFIPLAVLHLVILTIALAVARSALKRIVRG